MEVKSQNHNSGVVKFYLPKIKSKCGKTVVPCISAGVNIAQGRNASVFRRWRQTNERNTVFSISSLVTSPSSHLPRQIIITLNANNAADSEAQVQPGSGLRCGRGWRPQESGPTYASQGHTNRES